MKQMIRIQHLLCEAEIGIYAHELHSTQPLILDLELEIDAAAVIASRCLEDTLDYDALSLQVRQFVASQRFDLLERLLYALLQELAQHQALRAAQVTIEKPRALEAYGARVSLSGRWQRDA